MKKAWIILWAAIIGVLLSSAALASSSKQYRLDEVGMSVEIPSDLIVLTRDIQPSDPALVKLGMTTGSVKSTLEASNIFLDAISEDGNYEILIIMIASTVTDFHLLSDSQLYDMEGVLRSGYEDQGITDFDSEIYQHSQAKFEKIYGIIQNEATPDHLLQYYTVYNGKAINLTMHSYDGGITTSDEVYMKHIVDSVVFDTAAATSLSNAPRVSGSNSLANYFLGNFVFDFIGIFLIYCAPISIYRFLIKKERVSKKKGLKIAILYGIFAFIVIMMLQTYVFGGSVGETSVILWSYANYLMLTKL